jgi:hypothetical protein
MVITPVDQRYFDIGSLERPRCRDTGETAADDQDALFAWDRLRYSGLFLRERFGQNCSHGSTPRFRGQATLWYGIWRPVNLERRCGA